MAKEKPTHQELTDFDGPVDTGNPQAKRPADNKKAGQKSDLSDKGETAPAGKISEAEIKALFAGVEGLSEEFTTKATVVFEGAVSEKVETIREELKTEYAAKLEEAVADAVVGLEEKVDSYINYVVENFMTENKIAIEEGIKTEIAEQVIESVTAIIESNGVVLPTEKVDVAESLAEELKEVETKLNESTEEVIALKGQIRKYEIAEAFSALTADMSDASKERIKKLSENISYGDVADYTARVTILKETLAEGGLKKAAPADVVQQLTEHVVVTVPANPDDKLTPQQRDILNWVRGL